MLSKTSYWWSLFEKVWLVDVVNSVDFILLDRRLFLPDAKN
jgi:hypothetical protein